MIASCKNGISSLELHRAIGVTQKTAWFMLRRIRFAMQRGTFEMGGSGPVEVDETWIGGKARNMHAHRRAKTVQAPNKGKEMVLGLLDRETSRVSLKHVPDRSRATLQAEVRRHVRAGANVFSDEWAGYDGLEQDYMHMFVNHAEKYVEGQIHTNGIENFWALLKRSITGTYVSVEPFHLHRYLDEQAFRYNERKHVDGDAGRFENAIAGIVGKRLMYDQLIGGESAPTAVTV